VQPLARLLVRPAVFIGMLKRHHFILRWLR
jgi:hypothetical protein